MEFKEQSGAQTPAHKLGDVPHVSGLLRRIAQLSGAGERVAEWLLKVAIARGANHYRRDFDPTLPADLPSISDEEIGMALCLGQKPYNLDALRVAGQFLSSPHINAARLCRLEGAQAGLRSGSTVLPADNSHPSQGRERV